MIFFLILKSPYFHIYNLHVSDPELHPAHTFYIRVLKLIVILVQLFLFPFFLKRFIIHFIFHSFPSHFHLFMFIHFALE